MNKKIFFICSLFSLNLFAQAIKPNIVNGTPVLSNDPIAQTTVMITGKYQRFSFTCSGSIIADDLVITAAHCLGPYASAKLTVFFGLNKNQGGMTYNVTKQILPDNYTVDQPLDRNDIALLKLEKNIPVGYHPIKIISEADVLKAADPVILAGYGINVVTSPSNGDGGLGVLRYAEQNIIEPNYGQTEILISIKNKGTCSGDSGGPALIRKNDELILIGEASRMTDKDIVPGSKPIRYECTEEIVYTNIYKQMGWLKNAIELIRKN